MTTRDPTTPRTRTRRRRPRAPGSRAPPLLAALVVVLAAGCPDDDPGTVADVAARLGADPVTLDFGDVLTSAPVLRALTIRNTGRAAVALDGVELTGDGAFTTLGSAPATLSGQSSFTLGVRFAPTDEGVHGATLVVAHDGAASPLEVPLLGTGVLPPVCTSTNPCVDVALDASSGTCVSTNVDGRACESGSLCVVDGVCVDGRCLGTARDCPAVGGCVTTACEPALGCVDTRHHDACDDDDEPCTEGVCHSDGTCSIDVLDDLTPCGLISCADGVPICQGGACVSFPAAGFPCADLDLCTIDDTCVGGACVGGPTTTGPPSIVDEAPLWSALAPTALVADVVVTSGALGLTTFEPQLGPSAIALRLVERATAADVRCKSGGLLALDDARVACIGFEPPYANRLVIVDVTDGEVVDVITPPNASSETTLLTLAPPLFLAQGTLFVGARDGFDVSLLRATSLVDPSLEVVLTLDEFATTPVAGGDRYAVAHARGDFYTATLDGAFVVDLTTSPPSVPYRLADGTGSSVLGIAGRFLLVRRGTEHVALDLDEVTLEPPAFVVPPPAIPAAVVVPGLRTSRADIVDGVVVGLDAELDVVRAVAVDAAAVAPAAVAVPGADRLERVGPRAWLVAPGVVVAWVGGALVARRLDGPLAPAVVSGDDARTVLLHGGWRVDGLTPVVVGLGDTFALGATRAATPTSGDFEDVVQSGGALLAPPLAARGAALRVLDDDGAALTVVATDAPTPDSARVGAHGAALVELVRDPPALVARAVAPASAPALVALGSVPLVATEALLALPVDADPGDAGVVDGGGSSGDAGVVAPESVVRRDDAALDPTRALVAAVSTLRVVEYDYPLLSPPLSFVLWPHVGLTVVSFDDDGPPTVLVETTLPLPTGVIEPQVAVAAHDGEVFVIVSGYAYTGGYGDAVWTLFRVTDVESGAPTVTTLAPDDLVSSGVAIAVLDVSGDEVTAILGTSLVTLDFAGGPTVFHGALREAPRSVHAAAGLWTAVGASSATLLRPVCP